MQTVNFSQCTLFFLEKTFRVEEVQQLNALTEWLGTEPKGTDSQRDYLEPLRTLLDFNVDNWNEQELSLHFIGPLFSVVHFSSKAYNLFAQRSFSAQVGDYELMGRPDEMIASGFRVPEKPYFCFQEYKREIDPDGDPAGQCLAAMLAAQALNADGLPIYGCHVRGRNWFFMALEGLQYAISEPLVATRPDELLAIYGHLCALKEIVAERAESGHQ